jgi:hypothetical protein
VDEAGTQHVVPSRLKDMPLTPAAVRTPHGEEGENGASWCVLVDEARTVIAARPRREVSAAPSPTDGSDPAYRLIVAHPEIFVAHALTTWAFQQLDEDDGPVAVIVADDASVRGVWVGAHLEEVLAFGVPLSAYPVLPGDPHIPQIMRRCGYREDGRRCGMVQRFSCFPQHMPPCAASQLTAHTFVW